MIDRYYPVGAWVPVARRHARAPRSARKAERGLPTFDAVVDELLDAGEEEA